VEVGIAAPEVFTYEDDPERALAVVERRLRAARGRRSVIEEQAAQIRGLLAARTAG
jgi:hypothetical protein